MKGTPFTYALVFFLGLAAMFGAQVAWGKFAPCHTKYQLLSPVRRCTDVPMQGEWNYEPLRDALEALKAEAKAKKTLTHISIYFQDLDHGPRFGIGEYDKFQPASLIKLPVMMFYLHAADLDPTLLEKKLEFTDQLSITDNVTDPKETIQPNTPYTVRELIQKMIVYSDNRSYLMLLQEMSKISEEKAYDTFHDLDVLQMMLKSDVTYVSISTYAKLYAILYNTGYLSKEMSQYALELLRDVAFDQGIKAGVPKDMPVAHKFGYAMIDGEAHLHDCGIVYHPKMAYVLCVMTTGTSQDESNAVIGDVSRMVYEAVSKLDFDESQPAHL